MPRTVRTTFVSLSTYFACSITKQTRPDSPTISAEVVSTTSAAGGCVTIHVYVTYNYEKSSRRTHGRNRIAGPRWDVDRIASGSVSPAGASCPDRTTGQVQWRGRTWAGCGAYGVLVSFFVDVSLIATIIPTIVVSYTFAYLPRRGPQHIGRRLC